MKERDERLAALRRLPARGNVFNEQCPSREILGHVTGRWGGLILGALLKSEGGTLRFSELRRAVGGVTEKMLAETLRNLERDGLVTRKVHPVIPPHVDYALTASGADCARHIAALHRWLEEHVKSVVRCQIAYDA
jgi:DNA-binding HxlR family transcriptional regulator